MFTPLIRDSIVIHRTDSSQIEINTKTGEVSKCKILWTGPCEFELAEMHINRPLADGIDSFFAKATMKVKIIESKADFYIYSATIDSAEKTFKYKDTVRVLK